MMMRRGQRASRHQGSFFYGDLWKYLYEGLPENTVKFGRTVESLTVNDPVPDDPVAAFGSSSTTPNGERLPRRRRPTVSIGDETYDLVVVANGGFSTLRRYVLGDDSSSSVSTTNTTRTSTSTRKLPEYQQEPDYAGYVVWRGSVPTSHLSRTVLTQLEEGVYKNGVYDTILLKQAKDNGDDLWTMGTFIETPEEDVQQYWNKATDGVSRHGTTTTTTTTSSNNNKKMPEWLLKHFLRYFAHVPGLVELMKGMNEHGEVTPHPQFEFGYIERVHQGRIVLLGDAAHMASPRTAVGAHTAILDALGLMEAFSGVVEDIASSTPSNGAQIPFDDDDSNNKSMDMIDVALQRYSQYGGISRAHELYARSRQVSSEFVGHG
jgi:2-polyprenyl-6-methoxyphenol hydroxylase-like FAD-dependent oxidoreductase